MQEDEIPDSRLSVQLSSLPRSFTDLNAEVITRLSADTESIKLAVGKQAAVATTIRPHQLTTSTQRITHNVMLRGTFHKH